MGTTSKRHPFRNSTRGVSAPITAIVVSTALILLASYMASSSFAAITAMDSRQLRQGPAVLIHYSIESLCLSESPMTTQFIVATGSRTINVTGSTITCAGADFTGVPDPACIVLSAGEGFIEYDPRLVAFKSSSIIHSTARISILLSFDDDSCLHYLEVAVN